MVINMLNLDKLEMQIREFIEVSGDDINDVINHGEILSFFHISLIKKGYSEVTLDKNGVIKLIKQAPISSALILEQNIENGSASTILAPVIVEESEANTIQDVIAFVARSAA